MLSEVNKWLDSPENIFKNKGCVFDISTPPPEAPVRSITLDFEVEKYLCRLIFWEEGYGHVEVLEINTGKTFKNESFDSKQELGSSVPFHILFKELQS